jgi:hypothetical protein
MQYRFTLRNLGGFDAIERFFTEFSHHLTNDKYTKATIDLEQIDFLAVEAMLSLLCASKHWSQSKGYRVKWLTSDNVTHYLERADVMRVFQEHIEFTHRPDEEWSRGSSLSLMELRELEPNPEQNSIDVSNIIAEISGLLLGRVSTKQLGAASTLMSEVAQNIIHSQSMGYATTQAYQQGRKHRVHLGVIDNGVGIATSLSTKYPDLKRTSDYIKLSLESGVTSKTQGDGLGLYQVDNMVRRDRGALTIRTGTGMLQVYKGRVYHWDDLAFIPGTQVYITMWGGHEQKRWNYLLRSSES